MMANSLTMAELPNQIDGERAMVRRALLCLHPNHADGRPCVFLLEIGAALLSVLALRDAMLGAPGFALELPGAVGLWALLLATACCLAWRDR